MLLSPSALPLFLATAFLTVTSGAPLWDTVCTDPAISQLPFCDTHKPLEDRVKDYVSRVPTESQIAMMGHQAAGYDPLKIPPYNWWSEGLHGPLEPCVSLEDKGECRCPTSFPCPSGLATAFNTTLYLDIGTAIGKEGRAISNVRKHDGAIGDGLTYWSPVINLQRDPRWGRNQEAPGEDPHLTSEYSNAFVQGLQGPAQPAQIQVGAACKHYVANSLEQWHNYSRHNFNAVVSDKDLNEYYLPPFQACLHHSVGVMCSYNAVNGIPSCTNPNLQKDLLRDQWKFDGYLTTDCGALNDVQKGHHYAKDAAEASALAVNVTVDINCGGTFHAGLLQAYQNGMVTSQTIAQSFARLTRVQMRLGLFDHPKPFDGPKDFAVVGSHESLALEAALQSVVLLKNDDQRLPLDPHKAGQKLAVVGPHINANSALLSNYHGERCGCNQGWSCIETPLQAVARVSKTEPDNIDSVQGCNVDGTDLNEIEKATAAATKADVVVLFVGIDGGQEAEGRDRYNTTLPGLQQELVDAVLEVAAAKTVLVLIHGGMMSLGQKVIDSTPAIVSAPYGGEAGSAAIASVLFGEYNPTAKLAATMYPPSYVTDIPLTEMGLNVGVGRTHMYYKGTPEFAFGHGLSYSKWELEEEKTKRVLSKEIPNLKVSIQVTNTGPLEGGQNILLFWHPPASKNNPMQKLVGFGGTSMMKVGETATIQVALSINAFRLWNDKSQKMELVQGTHVLRVQGASVEKTLQVEIVEDLAEDATKGGLREEAVGMMKSIRELELIHQGLN